MIFLDGGQLPQEYNVTFLGSRNRLKSNLLRNTFETFKLSLKDSKNPWKIND